MRAIGYTQIGHLSEPDSLVEFETNTPHPGPNDLLVEVKGISVVASAVYRCRRQSELRQIRRAAISIALQFRTVPHGSPTDS